MQQLTHFTTTRGSVRQRQPSDTVKMNKTKAYRRLRKKQQRLSVGWAEQSNDSERTIRLPLQDIKQLGIARSNSAADVSMFGLRNLNSLKNFIEVVDLEKEAKPETCRTSLPSIGSKQRYLKNEGVSKGHKTGYMQSVESDSSLNTKNGYTILQAKLDALILPTPIKRKASRSFSGSSSGFHGRKMAVPRKDAANKHLAQSRDENETSKESGIQFPIASKMRQLLTIEHIEQPEPVQEVVITRAVKSVQEKRNSSTKDVTKAARFYFPNYAKQKQKTVAIPASSDLTTRPYRSSSLNRPNTNEPRLPKQVSFVEESERAPIVNKIDSTKAQKQQTTVTCANEPPVATNSLVLTTKNLEMYNTLTMTAELSVPSDEDERVVSWVRDRQQWVGEMCEDIPEMDENIKSATPHDTSSDSTSFCGE